MGAAGLLVFGDAAADITMRVSELPAAGLDAVARDPAIKVGGSAANCASVAARLGASANLVARVGDDLFSDIILDHLATGGVGTGGIEVTRGPSALVVTLVEPGGRRTFVSSRGPAAGAVTEDLWMPLLDEASTVHISGYSFQTPGSRSTGLSLLDEARKRGITTSFDPSPLFADHYRTDAGWLEGIDYLFPNSAEATAITGASTPEAAAEALRGLGADTVVITMGAEGCLLSDGEETVRLPAVEMCTVVDTTGAGDGFAGGFLAVRMAGGTRRQAAGLANLVAARVISEVGGHAGCPSLEDLGHIVKTVEDESVQTAFEHLKAVSTGGDTGT